MTLGARPPTRAPVRLAATAALALASILLGCGSSPAILDGGGDRGPPVDGASSAADDFAAADSGVLPDSAPPADSAAPADLAPSVSPVSRCPVAPMDQLYPGGLPPNPYAMIPAASPCVAQAHDVIVVLGCPSNNDGTPSTCQTRRADLAVAFATAGLGARFITSGAAVANPFIEADALKQLLIARGIAAGDVLTDPQARHTDENLYYSTRIMEQHGWTNAIVISDDAGHLVLTATCDSNCCVDLGRLTVLSFSVGGMSVTEGHYVRYPWASAVTPAECAQIELPFKLMCANLASRSACAGRLMLPPGPTDGGVGD